MKATAKEKLNEEQHCLPARMSLFKSVTKNLQIENGY